MISKWRWLLLQLSRKLWIGAAFFVLVGIMSALVSPALAPYIPYDLPGKIGSDSVAEVLKILASSMLAVTTFSLGVMVQAYSAATDNVTPRATKLIVEDHTTQNVLATFIGSFLFGLVGIVALSTGYYGGQARLILFFVTLVVILVIVVTLLRWIEYLLKLGRVGETSKRGRRGRCESHEGPNCGAVSRGQAPRHPDTIPAHAYPVISSTTGYIQYLDVEALQACAEKHDVEIFATALPGTFVHPGRAMASVVGGNGDKEAMHASVEATFTIGDERSFDQDPRFGLSVLAEIASRALSAAVNDPGTAIDIIGRLTRVLMAWAAHDHGVSSEKIVCDRVYVPPLTDDDLLDDAFRPLARDGAGLLEIQLHIQKALAALAQVGNENLSHAAQALAHSAFATALQSMQIDEDKERLKRACRAAWIPIEGKSDWID